MDASRCPAREELEGLLDERLTPADLRRVSTHVAECAHCQKALDTLTADAGTDLPSWRGNSADSSPPNPEFLDRIKRAPPTTPPPWSAADAVVAEGAAEDAIGAPFPELPDYEILEVLGQGGEGVVYKARHRPLGRLVALKMLRHGEQPQSLARFRLEAETLARLHHPNIIQVYEVGSAGGRPFFAMEQVEGGTLSVRLQGQPQPPRDAAALMEALARAVHAAHQAGVVHRDLKPANILLGPDRVGQTFGTPKISDFGLAKRVQVDSSLTRTGMVLGTPAYMAPEQARADGKEVGPSCDIYALGSILYHLLTGRPPFVGARPMDVMMQVVHDEPAPPRRLFPQAPRDLETICLKCLHKDPRRRYATAEALAEDLRRWLDGRPVLARPTPAWERVWKAARRRPVVAVLIAACTVALGLLIGGGAWSNAWLTDYNHRLSAAVNDAGHKADAAHAAERKEADAATTALAAEKDATSRAAEANLQRSLALDAYQKLIFDVQNTMDNRPDLAGLKQRLLQTAADGLHGVAGGAETAAPDLARAQAHQKLAILFDLIGDKAESQHQFQACLRIAGDLARAGPYDDRVQDLLCLDYDWLGNIANRSGSVREAAAYFRQEADQAASWLTMDSRSLGGRELLARACEHVTIASFRMNDAQAVDAWNARLVTAAEDWSRADPKNATARLMRMQAHGQRGQLLEEAGDAEGALEHYRQASEAADGLTADGPQHEQAEGQLRMLQKSLIGVLIGLGRPAEALPYAEAAAAASRKAREAGRIDPNDLEGQLECAEAAVAYATVLQRLLRFTESVKPLDDALDVLRPLEDRAKTAQDKARMRALIDRTAGAVAFSQAVPRAVADPAFALAQPTVPRQNLLVARVCVLMSQGRIDDARKAADQVDDLHYESADEYLSLAGFCAAAVGSIAPDEDADHRSPEEEAMRRRLAGRAVAALDRAVALGFKDLGRLRTDGALGTVRQDSGFRALVKRLEEGQ